MNIHWHEGLFLLPHHLQRFQKHLGSAVHAERHLSWDYPYGVIEMEISQDDLKNFRLRFDRLKVAMPCGFVVDISRNADLPVVDIKSELQDNLDLVVFLGVPLWFEGRANCLPEVDPNGPLPKVLYRLAEREVSDENTGKNAKVLVERKLNARLVFEGQDHSDMEVVPLLKVSRGAGETVGLPRQDSGFVGPCLHLGGSLILRDLVRSLASQVQASRQELLLQLTRGGFSLENVRGLQLEQMLRLRVLSLADGRLSSLLEVPTVTPFRIYLELRDLLSELAALHPDRDLFDTLPYDHDRPYPCFAELARKIRLFLRGGVSPNFIKVPFTEADGMLEAQLSAEHFDLPTDYFLGITTKEDPIDLARFVENEDQFKLMPASMAQRAVRGVLLKEERLPPLELPSQAGLYYFRLLRNECKEVWSRIKEEKQAIVRWTGRENADYQVTFYMTLPPNS